jgi:plastocyanin
MQSLFGTRTTADINLVAQIVLLVGLWVGFVLARKKRFGNHANVQTTMVLANLVFIAFAMGISFYDYVIQGGTGDSVARWMIVHGVLGTIAEVMGIYLIIRMRTKWLPKGWRIKNFKLLMRSTLALWTILVILGVVIYAERYLDVTFEIAEKRGAAAAPLFQMQQAGSDLSIHAAELQDAAARGSLEGTKRHAEHLVNLIDGEKGLHYGDVDIDGRIEDPGDGTGLLVYVDRVAAASHDAEIEALAAEVHDQLIVVRQNAETIALASDLAAVEDLVAPTVALARRVDSEGLFRIGGAAQAAGVEALPYTEPPLPGSPVASKFTIVEEDFAFKPFEVTVEVGTTVVWVNKERAKHTATSDVALFDSGDQPMGNVYEYTFTEPGRYPYYCVYHGDKGVVGMAGVIIVE